MAEYIKREWLLDVVENIIEWDTERDRNRAIHQVRELTPAADVTPIRHGRWIEKPYLLGVSRFCSLCGSNYGMPHEVYNYCPNCGALMDKEAGDGAD